MTAAETALLEALQALLTSPEQPAVVAHAQAIAGRYEKKREWEATAFGIARSWRDEAREAADFLRQEDYRRSMGLML